MFLSDQFISDSDDPTWRAIMKYCKHTSILVIKKCKKRKRFYFFHVILEEVFKDSLVFQKQPKEQISPLK